jgi:hypothetical protein
MIMVIGVDLTNNKMLVLSGKEYRPLTAEDLVQVIGKLALWGEATRVEADIS